jgi:UMF1 family MFS transporter
MPESTSDKAGRAELVSWAMYDFANSGYSTVVLTAVFSAWFVGAIAGGEGGLAAGTATLLWTLTIAASNALVLITGPLVGALADQRASKKQFLLLTTIGCAGGTALLAGVGPGDFLLAMGLVFFANVMFSSGENLIAAFLPEIAEPDHMGRISGYGWSLGYVGGLLTLGLCLAYLQWAQAHGTPDSAAIPNTMLITAAVFAVAAVPTFIWLRERAIPVAAPAGTWTLARTVFGRLGHTLTEVRRFQDLARLLVSIALYQSGVITVIVLAAVYAKEVMDFDTRQLLLLIVVVNVTSAVGAFLFGHFQDRVGSKLALGISLCLWVLAVILALRAQQPIDLWIVGNIVGLAMGASQSIGRAMVGQFTPVERTGEFFGLWGLANRLAAILGPLSYGFINYLSDGDHRIAMLSTLVFLLAGLAMLQSVDVSRGRASVS